MNDDWKKKSPTSSGGGYRARHEMESEGSVELSETTREQAKRQRRERKEELHRTPSDDKRSEKQREKVLADRAERGELGTTQAEVNRTVTSWLFPLSSTSTEDAEDTEEATSDCDCEQILEEIFKLDREVLSSIVGDEPIFTNQIPMVDIKTLALSSSHIMDDISSKLNDDQIMNLNNISKFSSSSFESSSINDIIVDLSYKLLFIELLKREDIECKDAVISMERYISNSLYCALANADEISFDLSIIKDRENLDIISNAVNVDVFLDNVDISIRSVDADNTIIFYYSKFIQLQDITNLPDIPPEGDVILSCPSNISESSLIGFETEYGVTLGEDDDVIPQIGKYPLATTELNTELGLPLLSLESDQIPGRRPQLELVSGPLNAFYLTDSEYRRAMQVLSEVLSHNSSLHEALDSYNLLVSEKYQLVINSSLPSDLINSEGSIRLTPFVDRPDLIATNVQSTVQIKYSDLFNSESGFSRLFAENKELLTTLKSARKIAKEAVEELGLVGIDRDSAGSWITHALFEMAMPISLRKDPLAIKIEFPMLFRTDHVNAASQVLTNHALDKINNQLEVNSNYLSSLLHKLVTDSDYLKGVGMADFMAENKYRSAKFKKYIHNAVLIKENIKSAFEVGNFSINNEGYYITSSEEVSFLKVSDTQHNSFKLNKLNNDIYIAIELRRGKWIKPFTLLSQGVDSNNVKSMYAFNKLKHIQSNVSV